MFKNLIISLALLWCGVASATARSYYSQQITYDINESVISSDLGLSALTGAQIGAAVEAGSIAWSNLAGSQIVYKWSGSTTTASTCTGGQNIVTASNFSCPFGCEPATITFCNNNLNWLITINKGYTTYWSVATSNSSVADLQSVSAWAFGIGLVNGSPSGAVYSTGSSCLTQSNPTTSNLMRYRTSFCETEVASMYNSGNGTRYPASFGANDVWYMTSTAYPSPSGTQWSGSSSSIGSFQNEQSGLGGLDFARGLVSGSRQDAFFDTVTEKASPTLPTYLNKFNQVSATVSDPPTSLSSLSGSLRRPSIVFDTCRNVWVLMAQTAGASTPDTFSIWTSSDLSTWSLTTPIIQYSDSVGTKNIISRQPVGLYYDPHWDAIVIAWNNDDPTSPVVSPCNTSTPALYQRGCAHELMATVNPANWVEKLGGIIGGATRFRNDAYEGLIGYTGVTVACDHTSLSAQFLADFNCVIAESAVDDDHTIWFQNFGYSFNYSADTCFSGSSWGGPAFNGAQADSYTLGRSHWTPSFSVAKNGSSDVGFLAVTGVDNKVYTNQATLSQDTVTTTSSWAGWVVPVDPWNTSISLTQLVGPPVVKVDQTGVNTNYMILLTGVTAHP